MPRGGSESYGAQGACGYPLAAGDVAPKLPPPIGTDRRYRPNGFDLGFLPPPLRLAKDAVRSRLGAAADGLGETPGIGAAWNRLRLAPHTSCLLRAGRVFIHVPKTGGTSICQPLYGRNLPHFSARFYAAYAPQAVARLPSFAVIRHPIARAISAWRFLHGGGTAEMACNLHERAVLEAGGSFERFVDHLADRGVETLPPTVWTQAAHVADTRGEVIVDRLFSLDGEGRLAPGLTRWIGRPLPRLNASGRFEASSPGRIRTKLERIYARDMTLYDRIAALGGEAEARGWRLDG